MTIWFPAVVVHGADDVAATLAPGRPVLLLSAPGAALYAGVGWWRALVAQGQKRYPGTPMQDALDCADAPGRAMEALRMGQTVVILSRSAAWEAVAAVADLVGAVVLDQRPGVFAGGLSNRLETRSGRDVHAPILDE